MLDINFHGFQSKHRFKITMNDKLSIKFEILDLQLKFPRKNLHEPMKFDKPLK